MLKHIESIERIQQDIIRLTEEVRTNTGVDGVNQKITKDAVLRRLGKSSVRLKEIEEFIVKEW